MLSVSKRFIEVLTTYIREREAAKAPPKAAKGASIFNRKITIGMAIKTARIGINQNAKFSTGFPVRALNFAKIHEYRGITSG